jgi:hypothetical protein
MLRDDVRRHQQTVAREIEAASARGNFRHPDEAIPSVHITLAGELLDRSG